MSEHNTEHEYADLPVGDSATPSDTTSIIDTILGLDELLSADVRRAEDVHRLYRRPDLQAEISRLEDELAAITEPDGTPLAAGDEALGESGTAERATALAQQIHDAIRRYRAESGLVQLRQLDGDDWEAFKTKWKRELDAAQGPSVGFWNALIAETVSEPKLTVTQVIKLRQLYGPTQTEQLGQHCWEINTKSGVSVPKSSRSSRVLKRQEHEAS